MDGVEDFMVAGYAACQRCGEWILLDSGSLAVCRDCRMVLKDRAEEARFRYEVAGREFTLEDRPQWAPLKPTGPRQARNMTPEQLKESRAAHRAKSRAILRLIRIYHPMYELLLGEERLREGLNPTINRARPRQIAAVAELLADIEDSEARDVAMERFDRAE